MTAGGKQPPEYQIWSQIKQWCLNKRHWKYPQYGGRGIKIHPAWAESFLAFFDEVGHRPSKKYRLSRIDFNKGYLPGNVKWSTIKEHERNTNKNRIVTYQGQRMALAEAAERAGIDRRRAQDRLESGWSEKEAFERPVEGGTRYIEWKGARHVLSWWARKLKMHYQTLHSRIFKMGWTVEEAFTTPLDHGNQAEKGRRKK